MILTDAGPLIALIDRSDADHRVCVEALDTIILPLVTTWPAFTEAMYILGSTTGSAGQRALWQMHQDAHLQLLDLERESVGRASELMEKYADRPMDLADATLVAAAEQLDQRRIFTIHGDFRFYRRADRTAFTLVP